MAMAAVVVSDCGASAVLLMVEIDGACDLEVVRGEAAWRQGAGENPKRLKVGIWKDWSQQSTDQLLRITACTIVITYRSHFTRRREIGWRRDIPLPGEPVACARKNALRLAMPSSRLAVLFDRPLPWSGLFQEPESILIRISEDLAVMDFFFKVPSSLFLFCTRSDSLDRPSEKPDVVLLSFLRTPRLDRFLAQQDQLVDHAAISQRRSRKPMGMYGRIVCASSENGRLVDDRRMLERHFGWLTAYLYCSLARRGSHSHPRLVLPLCFRTVLWMLNANPLGRVAEL
nr:hypothetical protein CFP56_13343 [Quercus suber]